MKKLLSFLLFAAVIAGAVYVAPILGQQTDNPFEAGLLKAPEIDRHHGAATEGEGHEAPAHGETPVESHS